MVDEFTLENTYTGYRIHFDRDAQDYLIDDNGIDWGETTTDLSLSENMDTFGSTVTSIKTITPRRISMTGWIIGTETEMSQKKLVLSKFLEPSRIIRILITSTLDSQREYYIDTYVTGAVKFAETMRDNNDKMCRFSFVLEAPFPFFILHKTYRFTSFTQEQIQNKGCLAIGLQMSITFETSVTNPQIALYDGQNTQYFKLIGDFNLGDQIDIDTRSGKKYLSIPWSNLNLESDWLIAPVCWSDNMYLTINVSGQVSAIIQLDEAYTSVEDL